MRRTNGSLPCLINRARAEIRPRARDHARTWPLIRARIEEWIIVRRSFSSRQKYIGHKMRMFRLRCGCLGFGWRPTPTAADLGKVYESTLALIPCTDQGECPERSKFGSCARLLSITKLNETSPSYDPNCSQSVRPMVNSLSKNSLYTTTNRRGHP